MVEGGPGHSTLALSSALAGQPEQTVRIALKLANGPVTSFRAAFDFLPQIDVSQEPSEVFWFKLAQATGADDFPGVSLSSRNIGNTLIVHNNDGAQPSYEVYSMEALPEGWVHVEVAITFGTLGMVSVHFNGKRAALYRGPVYSTDVVQTYLQLGIYSQVPSTSSALYDNVVVDVTL